MVIEFWITNFGGELAALSAALLWAMSAVVFAHLGQKIPPLLLNLSKGIVAIALIAFTLLIQGNLSFGLNSKALGLLLLSGILGIGLGDTFYFESLNNIGARRTLLLQALAPPLTALIALIFLQETLSTGAWAGIFLTVLGIAWVVSERVPVVSRQVMNLPRGVSFALLAALGQASGAVLSRAALSGTTVTPLWSTLVRITGGILILLLWIPLKERQPRLWLEPLQSIKIVGIIIVTAIFSTFLAIWLQQTALKLTAAGIAQALLATSPLFVLPLAMWMGEKVSFRAFLGVLVALGGIALLFSLQ
ncbi:MAG: DMT family transporter [Kastovskya adunca ATA6-11-RM4]|jgi:drug/metabolite transporter (DMT)-like permease|nr:DMT family transporter [Kastovskya adunca ATA6-11-RM4]